MLCSSLLPAGEAEHLQTAPGTAEHSLHPSRVWPRHHLWVTLSEQLLVGHQQPRAWETQAWKLAGMVLLLQ